MRPILTFSCIPQVAMEEPGAVTVCNLDLENLVQDPNRSIATLAITTLLKTGTEASVERLMKQIAKFMGEIPDEFKVVVMKVCIIILELFSLFPGTLFCQILCLCILIISRNYLKNIFRSTNSDFLILKTNKCCDSRKCAISNIHHLFQKC